MNLILMARKRGFTNRVEVMVMRRHNGIPHCLRRLEPADFIPIEEGYEPESTFIIDNTVAQELMDDLWNCGLRPSEGAGSAGAMLAVQEHLKDMRHIAFTKLGLDKLDEMVDFHGGQTVCGRDLVGPTTRE
jgi:hypothetical protein